MSPAAGSTLTAWTRALHQVAALQDQLRFALRIAGYTNQRAVARRLLTALERLRDTTFDVTVLGKPECGATLLAAKIQAAFPDGPLPAVRPTIVETPDYFDLDSGIAARAQASAAIVLAIPAAAPFFDETSDFLARHLSSHRDKVLLAALTDPYEFCKEVRPDLEGFALYMAEEFADALSDLLAVTWAAPLIAEMRAELRRSSEQLLPVANTFAEFLSMPTAQYARQLDFVRRDADALKALARKVQEALDAQSRKALADIAEALQGLSQTMRKQAESAIAGAAVSKETLAGQEQRTQLGRQLVSAARAAGYGEFESRMQSLAMNLNSSRSVLLSMAGQLRAEAQARFDELSLNLGAGAPPSIAAPLLRDWLQTASPGWPERPLDVSFDAGAEFPNQVMAAAHEVRRSIPESEFTSGWASRIDGLYRGELNGAATAGWTSANLDQKLADVIYAIWNEAAGRNCGILIGRLHWVYRAVTDGIASCRLGNLQAPADLSVRAKLGEAYRGFTARLETMAADESAAHNHGGDTK